MLSATAAVGAAGAAGAAADIAITRCATCVPPGPPVDAGSRVRRDILPAVFEIVLDPAVARATVTVFLGEATMNGIMIDYRNPVAPFSVGAGGCSMTGTVMLRLNDTPNVSALYIDGVVSGSPDPAKCTATARRAARGVGPDARVSRRPCAMAHAGRDHGAARPASPHRQRCDRGRRRPADRR
ncbi:hypothetical protein ASE72_03715 [Sphingomonas sp. Leaf20]|nr:hypothetical protein ASE72_03715 [Sphingomonas sp. Leaf20]